MNNFYFIMNLYKKGFTLIELLVVVAIIGLLATMRQVAEIFYLDNSNSYLPAATGVTFPIGTCPTYISSGTNMLSKNKNIADSIAEALKRGNGSSCYNSDSTWAVAVGLKLVPNTSWCVDVTGTAKVVNSIPSGAINTTTFTCN